MTVDVRFTLQKDGFIILFSIRPSVRMSADTNVTFWVKVLCEVFSFAYIFESFLSRLLMFDYSYFCMVT